MKVFAMNMKFIKQWCSFQKEREGRDFPLHFPLNFQSTAGFSLIEMLVVVTLLIIIALIGTNLFLGTLTSSNKAAIGLSLKQQGDYAMSSMVSMIRSAVRIESCSASSLTIRNPDGLTTQFTLANSKIASNSGNYLTGDDVAVTSGPTFTCTLENEVYTFANISFTLKKGDIAVDKPIVVVQQSFTGGVGVRKY